MKANVLQLKKRQDNASESFVVHPPPLVVHGNPLLNNPVARKPAKDPVKKALFAGPAIITEKQA